MERMMERDFWISSGHHFLDRDPDGRLVVTDEFLKLFLARPEIAPVEESGPFERALHAVLLQNPRSPIDQRDFSRIEDADARENYAVWARFRDRLLAAPNLEAAYLALFRQPAGDVPALFIDQLAALALRNALDGCDSAFRLRAAELFFRPQRVTIQEGAILLGDEEVVESKAAGKGFGALGDLIAQSLTPMRSVDLDILTTENAEGYWSRSDRHDFVIDLSFARPGLDAFCRVMETWILHLLGIDVQIEPVQRIRDERWVWHIGLDAAASGILNDLYEGRDVEEARQAQVLSLFRLNFRDPARMLERVRGRPVYLALAMDGSGRLRMKPQNLLVNLPLANAS